MEIKFEKITDLTATLHISLEKNEYAPLIEKELKSIRNKVTMKGFRPGTAPIPFIRKIYGGEIFSETINKSFNTIINQKVEEENLFLVAQPFPLESVTDENWESKNNISITFKLGFATIDAIDLSKISLKKYKIKASEKDIQDEIEMYQNKVATYDSLEKVDEGNLVVLKVVDSEQEIYVNNKNVLSYASILDKKEGDEVELVLKDFLQESYFSLPSGQKLKDIDALQKLRIEQIGKLIIPEYNEEFFKKIFPTVSTEEEFRVKIVESIESIFDSHEQSIFPMEAKNALIEVIKVNIPQDFLKENLLFSQPEMSAEEVDSTLKEWTEGIKWDKIVDELTKQYDIKVSAQEIIEEEKKNILQAYGMVGMPINPEMDAHLERLANQNLKKDKESARTSYMVSLIHKLIRTIEDKFTLETIFMTDKDEYRKIYKERTEKFKSQSDHHDHDHTHEHTH